MTRRTVYSVVLLGSLVLGGCAGGMRTAGTGVPYFEPAEGPIPGVPAETESSDYWIRSAPDSDEVILDAAGIDSLNAFIMRADDLIEDVPGMPERIAGTSFRDYIAGNARYLADAPFTVTGTVPLEQVERERIIARMDTLAVPETIDIRWGMTLVRVMGKNWPTDIPLMIDPGDNEFDQNVAASVDMATPVALIHLSRDGRWVFVRTPRFLCWLPAQTVAFGSREVVASFLDPVTPLVATGDEVTVYGDPTAGVAVTTLGMGGALPLRTAGTDFCRVAIPVRGEDGALVAGTGYVRRRSDVSIGYLPYTFRNLYRQAFVLYGSRYGWGGMYGGRDCSAFVMDLFRCFNIQLPRNSAAQAQASPAVVSFEGMDRDTRFATIEALPAGITLLKLNGHIMLYLGESAGTPYAIHDFWAWREPDGDNPDIVKRAARVAVTDLMLGDGSAKGAYIDRLTHGVILGAYVITSE